MWVAAMLLLVAGCGNAVGAESGGNQASAISAEADAVQSCQALLDSGWTAPEGDPSFLVDPETWIVEVSFGEESTLLVNVSNDPTCFTLPDIGGPLSRVLPEYEQIRVDECTDAVASVIAGEVPKKGPATGSLEALRQHVLDWCPPSFADRLPAT